MSSYQEVYKARRAAQFVFVLIAIAIGVISFLFFAFIGQLGLFPTNWTDWVNNQQGWGVLLIFVLTIGAPALLIAVIFTLLGSLSGNALMHPTNPLPANLLANINLIALCVITGLLFGWQTT